MKNIDKIADYAKKYEKADTGMEQNDAYTTFILSIEPRDILDMQEYILQVEKERDSATLEYDFLNDQIKFYREKYVEILHKKAELETICGEAYQAVGYLAYMLGVFETSQSVSNLLDNLSECKLVHDDILPFFCEELTDSK